MSLRKRILVGLSLIGFVFFLLGTVAVVQSVQFGHSKALPNAIAGIEACQQLTEEAVKHARLVADQVIMPDSTVGHMAALTDSSFVEQINAATGSDKGAAGLLNLLRNNSISAKAYDEADTLYYAYGVLRSNMLILDSLFAMPQTKRAYWYKQLYEPSLDRLLHAIKGMSRIHQAAALNNGMLLEKNFYRMIFPPLVLLIAGLLLIVFFYYLVGRRIDNING